MDTECHSRGKFSGTGEFQVLGSSLPHPSFPRPGGALAMSLVQRALWGMLREQVRSLYIHGAHILVGRQTTMNRIITDCHTRWEGSKGNLKGRNEQSRDYLRKNILDKEHTGRQRPDYADLVGHGKGLGVCSACEGGPLGMWRVMGKAGTMLAARSPPSRETGGMVAPGEMERNGGRTGRTCWWVIWDMKEGKESLVTSEFCGLSTSISVVHLSSVRCHEASKWW